MSRILCVNQLTKRYHNRTVLQDVHFSVEQGRIVGLLGRNASGKSTLFKLIAGLTRPTSGQIQITGKEAGDETKGMVSFMTDAPTFDQWMKVRDTIAFYQDFYTDFDVAKVKQMLDLMEIGSNEKVTTLSKGTKEKLHLALVLSRKVPLYILDEPITGVDPVAREQILDAILEFYNEESSILISSHFMTSIERLLDEVLILKDKTITLHKNTDDIRQECKKSLDQWALEVL
jgi:ABC-2 type transport system ATP-binding protein